MDTRGNRSVIFHSLRALSFAHEYHAHAEAIVLDTCGLQRALRRKSHEI